MPGQALRTRSGDPIGPPTLFRGQRLDPAPIFEPTQRAVQGAGAELGTSERLDVLGQRIPVLRPVGKAGEHQHDRFGELHAPLPEDSTASTTRDYTTSRDTYATRSTRARSSSPLS